MDDGIKYLFGRNMKFTKNGDIHFAFLDKLDHLKAKKNKYYDGKGHLGHPRLMEIPSIFFYFLNPYIVMVEISVTTS